MSKIEGSGIQNPRAQGSGRLKPRTVWLIVLFTVGVVLVGVFALVYSASTPPLSVGPSSVVSNGPQVASAIFSGIGNYYVDAECFKANVTLQCPLLVSMSLSTPDGVFHNNFYTRSITLKILNSPGSTMAFEVDTFTNPATNYVVGYGIDSSYNRFLTITMPSNGAGDTWSFFITVHDPPIVGGKMALQIEGSAQVVDTHFMGKTYNLDTGMLQLSDY